MPNKVYLRTIETNLQSASVADADFDFDLDPHAALNNILEHFYFIDTGGDQVDATGGTVVITMSSGGDIFQTVDNGSFNAVDARLASRTKPSGYGKAEKIRVTLAGITGTPVGFVGLTTQSVS